MSQTPSASSDPAADPTAAATRDIADVAAVEVITTAAVHLMSAAAVKCGLSEDTTDARGADLLDLDEARKLITALAALVTASARSFPPLTCGSDDVSWSKLVCAWPPTRSLTAGALPL